MPTSSRKAFVAGATAAFASVNVLRLPADAAEFNYKYGNNLPASNPSNVLVAEMVDKIKRETGGRLEISMFPGSVLGGDPAMLAQIRSGAIQFHLSNDSIFASVVPAAGIEGVGYAFPDFKTVYAALDGDFGKYVRQQFGKANMYAFDKAWESGYHEIFNALRPINTPSDLKGLKLRIPYSPSMVALFKVFGASALGISWAESYQSMQTHLIDGVAAGVVAFADGALVEVAKYGSMTNQMWSGNTFVANVDAWAALPKDIQNVVEKNVNEAALAQRAQFAKINAAAIEKLKSKGMIFNSPDLNVFRTELRAAGYYKAMRETFDPTGFALLEKYTGPLT